jgi:hypothetical protein
MSRFIQWLDHRRDVVGFEKRIDLSEYSVVSEDALRHVNTVGSLTVLDRSQRRWLAAALRVSLRKLEQLNSGEIEWINDDHVVDADVRGRPLARQEDDPNYWIPIETKPEDRGTALVGHIRSNGVAEPDEDWQEEWGRCLPARFGKGYDTYAMEIEGTRQCVVFRNIPAWELREGDAAIYAWDGCAAKGWFGHVMLFAAQGGRHHDRWIAASIGAGKPETIVRIGKVIGHWKQFDRLDLKGEE